MENPMDATRPEYDLDDLIAAAGTFAPDAEEGEIQAAPAVSATSTEQAKGFQGDREHILIVEINAALDKASQVSGGDEREKHRRAAGRKLVEAKKTISPDQWEKWCLDHVKFPFARVTKLVEAIERIQASNRKFMGEARAAADNSSVSGSSVQSDNKDTAPMDFNELIQAGVEEGILSESPEAEASTASEAAETSTRNSDGVEMIEGEKAERASQAVPTLTLETEADEIVTLLNEGVNRFVEAGRKLIAHKARIDETGQDWGLWVAKAFPAFAPRTLGRYMTLARRVEVGEAMVMLPASEDSEGPGDIIGLAPPVRDPDDLDETRYDAGEGEPDDDQVSELPDPDELRRQQKREAQARYAAKLAEAAGRTVKPRTPKDVAAQVKRLKTLVEGMDAEQLKQVCDMIAVTFKQGESTSNPQKQGG
jgi:hypothetical protein